MQRTATRATPVTFARRVQAWHWQPRASRGRLRTCRTPTGILTALTASPATTALVVGVRWRRAHLAALQPRSGWTYAMHARLVLGSPITTPRGVLLASLGRTAPSVRALRCPVRRVRTRLQPTSAPLVLALTAPWAASVRLARRPHSPAARARTRKPRAAADALCARPVPIRIRLARLLASRATRAASAQRDRRLSCHPTVEVARTAMYRTLTGTPTALPARRACSALVVRHSRRRAAPVRTHRRLGWVLARRVRPARIRVRRARPRASRALRATTAHLVLQLRSHARREASRARPT